jgi:hypothetical protein
MIKPVNHEPDKTGALRLKGLWLLDLQEVVTA